MKAIFPILSLLVCVVNTAGAPVNPSAENVEAERMRTQTSGITIERHEGPNEIQGKRFLYSGIAVQWVKTDHPLHLVNPAAPSQYGSGDQNLVLGRDPVTGGTSGWKFFAITF